MCIAIQYNATKTIDTANKMGSIQRFKGIISCHFGRRDTIASHGTFCLQILKRETAEFKLLSELFYFSNKIHINTDQRSPIAAECFQKLVSIANSMSQGLNTVFLDNREPLMRFLRARGAGDRAEDLVQDVWLRAAGSVSGPIANPRAYLFRIANNLMIDNHRAETQRTHREHNWSDARGTGDAGVSDEPSIEQSLIARSMLDKAQSVIDDLGEPTTTIFRRFRIDGASQKSIASELGVSLATVEKHLQKAYRAMLSLKKEFDTE